MNLEFEVRDSDLVSMIEKRVGSWKTVFTVSL